MSYGKDMRTSRRFHTSLVRLLQEAEMLRRGPVTQREFYRTFEVQPRTIRRDLATLGEVLPLYDEIREDGSKVWGILQ